MYSKNKDGDSRSFATHIDTAMKNGPGADNVVRGLFLLTGKPYIGEEAYREYAEVFREYLDISMKGVNFLKGKKRLLDSIGIPYNE